MGDTVLKPSLSPMSFSLSNLNIVELNWRKKLVINNFRRHNTQHAISPYAPNEKSSMSMARTDRYAKDKVSGGGKMCWLKFE